MEVKLDNSPMVGRDYVRCYHTKEDYIRLARIMDSLMNIRLGSVNVVAGNAVHKAMTELRNTPLYRHRAKKEINEAVKSVEDYEKVIRNTWLSHDKYQIWLDITDNVNEKMEPAISSLHQQIWNALVVGEIKHAREMAWLETARAICEYANCIYDRLCKEMKRKTGVDFSTAFIDKKLYRTLAHLENVCDMLCQTDKPVNLDADENCRRAFKVFENYFFNNENFMSSAQQAFEDNSDVIPDQSLLDFKQSIDNYYEEQREKEKKIEKFKKENERNTVMKRGSDITQEDLDRLKEKFNTR